MSSQVQHQHLVALGKSGLHVSPLAIGTGSNGWSGNSDQTRKGRGWLVDLLREGFDLGINFWDLADQYGSHDFASRALKSFRRETIVINTKTTAKDRRQCADDIDRFLTELGTDYVDSVLLHGVSSGDWPQARSGAMEALERARDQGKVRAVGISSHSLAALRTAAAHSWVQVILVRLNHAGINMDGDPETVIPIVDQAAAEGKGVYAMKVLACGALSEDPERAIRYTAALDSVHAMTIGFLSSAEMRKAAQLLLPQ